MVRASEHVKYVFSKKTHVKLDGTILPFSLTPLFCEGDKKLVTLCKPPVVLINYFFPKGGYPSLSLMSSSIFAAAFVSSVLISAPFKIASNASENASVIVG